MLIAKMKRGYYERRVELRHLGFAFKFAFQMVFEEKNFKKIINFNIFLNYFNILISKIFFFKIIF